MLLDFDYNVMIYEILQTILNRFERNENYNFIDMKLSLITGDDFPDTDLIRGKNTIYSWIQGRALESLSLHGNWVRNYLVLSDLEKQSIQGRINNVVQKVMTQMEICRHANPLNKLYFCMDKNGTPLEINSDGQLIPMRELAPNVNFSDIFYYKGLFQAAYLLNDQAKIATAKTLYLTSVKGIQNGEFRTDQQAFDPKNPVSYVSDKKPQGPLMIALSGLSEIGKKSPDEPVWFDTAAEIIEYIIKYHLNLGRRMDLKKFDFWEFIDGDGEIYLDNGKIICDPGHALELIGIATNALINMAGCGRYAQLIRRCGEIFPEMYCHIFNLGFNPAAHGICKSVDLLSRKMVNSDMPWWNLPESMRSGANLLYLYGGTLSDEQTANINVIIGKLSNSFSKYYVNRNIHYMACQNRNSEGQIIDIVPATPDADPGYHTNLSIIDFLRIYPADGTEIVRMLD